METEEKKDPSTLEEKLAKFTQEIVGFEQSIENLKMIMKKIDDPKGKDFLDELGDVQEFSHRLTGFMLRQFSKLLAERR